MSSASAATHPGFFSSSRAFSLPVGNHIEPESVGGYPIDMSSKARSLNGASEIAPKALHVVVAQYGLGCYERWLNGEGEQWLAAAGEVGRRLLATQEDDGSWLHRVDFPHTFPLPAPWRSAMAQGEAASLLVRLFLQTGDEAFAAAALAALEPTMKMRAEGGVCALLDGQVWLEEYPTREPSYVLNGAIFALWGLRDVAVALGEQAAGDAFEEGAAALAANLWRFDTGWWSLYSLYPHPVRNVASSFYHDLHINQLRAMQHLSPRAEFGTTSARWDSYTRSAINRRRAFVAKGAFRLLVPRKGRLRQKMTQRWRTRN